MFKKRKSTLALYLKQGFKGIFKFRIQFLIIIILGFISTFVLTISLSLSQRLTNEYDKVMNKMDRFDYISSKDVGVKANGKKDAKFVPMMDFINFQSLTKTFGDGSSYNSLDSGVNYNFNISNFDFGMYENDENVKSLINDYKSTYRETFLTKGFSDNEIIKNNYFGMVKSEDFLESFFDYKYDGLNGNTIYPPNQDGWTNHIDGSWMYREFDNKPEPIKNYFMNSSEELKRLLLNDLFKYDGKDGIGSDKKTAPYLINSPFFQLKQKSLIKFEDFSVNGYNEENLNPYDIYLYTSLKTVLSQIFYMSCDYIKYYVNQAISNAKDNTLESVKEKFNNNYQKAAGFEWLNNNNDTIANVLFAFIFGRVYGEQTNNNNKKIEEMVVSKKNKPWIQTLNLNEAAVLNYKGLVLQEAKDLYEFGARGSLNQFLVQLDSKDRVAGSVGTTNQSIILKNESPNETLNEVLSYDTSFNSFTDRNIITRSKVSTPKLYYLRNQLIGQASDLNIEERAEFLFQDNLTEIRYRMVVLDPLWSERLTIYQGRKPRDKNEVIINSQFAKAQHIKLGQNLTIGGGEFIVSGLASDPLSYFPISDTLEAIPNSAKTAIVYGNDATFESVISKDFQKQITKTLYTLVTNKSNEKNLDKNMSRFVASKFNNPSEIVRSLSTLNKLSNDEDVKFNSSESSEEFTKFASSPFAYNWELTPKVVEIFKLCSIILSSVVIIIALVATGITVKKTIEMNSSEIGILKSLGAKASEISLSYVWYGIFIMIFVIPVAWLTAAFTQETIARLFLSYMGGVYWQVIFNWQSFLIAFLLFGLLVGLVSYLVAYILTRKPALTIMDKKDVVKRIKFLDNLKFKLTKRTKFTTRFSIELAASGFSKTLLTGAMVFLSAFIVSGCLTLLGVVDVALSNYYKNVKYANNIQNVESIGNAPMSKTSLSAWQGVEEYDKYLYDSKGIFGDEVKSISEAPSNLGGVSDTSVLPHLTLNVKDGKLESEWLYQTLSNSINNNQNEDNNSLVSIIGSIFGNNINQLLGKGISLGEIQKTLDWIIHSNEFKSDEFMARKEKVKTASDLLSSTFPPIIAQLMNTSAKGEGTWKEQILDVIVSQTPSYIKNFFNKSENRQNQFEFGWTINNYIPTVDNLYTKINAETNNNKLSIIGLQSTQNAYNFSNIKNNIFLSEYKARKLQDVIYGKENQDIYIDNFKVYDKDNGELTIPTITNSQAKLIYPFKDDLLDKLTFNADRLVLSEDQTNIPNEAWMYDDRDYQKFLNHDLKDDKGWLRASALSANKMTYAPIFNYINGTKKGFEKYEGVIPNSLVKDSYGFFNLQSEYDENEHETLKAEIRPYYQYDNITLFIPKSKATRFEAIKNLGNKDTSEWFGYINRDNVPKDTVKQWENIDPATKNNDYVWIRPYSLYYDVRGKYEKPKANLTGIELSQLTDSYKNFLWQSFKSQNNPFAIANKTMDWNKISGGNIKKINLKSVGDLKVYGNNLIIADQNIVNLVHGYSIDKYLPFNYQYEDKNSQNNGSYTENGVKVNTYDYVNPNNLINNESSNNLIYGTNDKQKSIRPNLWYNGVYSNAKEPYFLTTQASFSRNPKIGEDTINGDSTYKLWVETTDTEFLSQQQALIDQISKLIISIGTLFISMIIIISSLATTLIADLYVNQYKKFMIIMKSLGYSNWKIIKYSFGFVSLFSMITYVTGVLTSYLVIFGITTYINNNFIAIPFGYTWWAPFVSTILVVGMFILSTIITTRKIRKEPPSSLMTG